jgi:RimJ/RimL family protein N-acetyltransferase
MRWAFDAGYRRYKWKCNALNEDRRRAAQRLRLSYEGVFRQAAVINQGMQSRHGLVCRHRQ